MKREGIEYVPPEIIEGMVRRGEVPPPPRATSGADDDDSSEQNRDQQQSDHAAPPSDHRSTAPPRGGVTGEWVLHVAKDGRGRLVLVCSAPTEGACVVCDQPHIRAVYSDVRVVPALPVEASEKCPHCGCSSADEAESKECGCDLGPCGEEVQTAPPPAAHDAKEK